MTEPVTTSDTTASRADGAPVVDDALVAVDPMLHSPGQPPGVTGPTRPNIIRAYPSDEPDPYATEAAGVAPSDDDTRPTEVDVDPDQPHERPAGDATKAVWVDYAVSLGADRSDADKTRKDDLIARWGQ